MALCAFFSPSLDPILEGGKRDKHAVIAPQVPAGGTVGHAIFNHQTHREMDHTMGVMTAGRSYIGQINVEVLPALRAVVRRVRHQEVHRTSSIQIAQVMYGALSRCVARRDVTTSWTGRVPVVSVVSH